MGGLPIATIRVRRQGRGLPVSATIGDVPMFDADRITTLVAAVGACGVDDVKVGIERVPQARAVLDALAAGGRAVVPVFIADKGQPASPSSSIGQWFKHSIRTNAAPKLWQSVSTQSVSMALRLLGDGWRATLPRANGQ